MTKEKLLLKLVGHSFHVIGLIKCITETPTITDTAIGLIEDRIDLMRLLIKQYRSE